MKYAFLALLAVVAAPAQASWTYLSSLDCNAANGVKIETTGAALDDLTVPVSATLAGTTANYFAQYTGLNGGMGWSDDRNVIELSKGGMGSDYVIELRGLSANSNATQKLDGTIYLIYTGPLLEQEHMPVSAIGCEVKLVTK
jgi:hypothetical protein